MKRLIIGSAVLAFVVAASGCGSSSSGGATGITGTIAGTPYASVGELSLVASGDACTLPTLAPGVSLGVSLALVVVPDVAATCTSQCAASGRELELVIARVHVPNTSNPSTAAPGFATGSYQYFDLNNPGTPTVDANGNISIFTGAVSAFDATCTATGGYFISTGTLTVTSVSGSTISGTVNVNLVTIGGTSAGSLSGTFSTSTNCTPSPAPSACDLLNGIVNPA